MNKPFTSITLLVFFALSLGNVFTISAQETDSLSLRKTRMLGIGLNYIPNHFKSNLKEVGESFELPWTYSIAYKHIVKKRILRASLNGNYLVRSPRSKNSEILASVGMEWSIVKGKRLNFNIGADLINYYSRKREPEWNSDTYGIGLGPVFNLNYDISQRFTLGTEVSLFYGIRNRKTSSSDGTITFQKRHEKYWGTHRFGSLHLYYKFGK